MYVLHEPLRVQPKCRVELHVHLDGAIRPETIWEVMRKKQLNLPGDGSLDDLKRSLRVNEPRDLLHFLQPFSLFLPAFRGDLEAIERFSFEFVEDQSKESVAYCEARFCPHLLLDSQSTIDLVNSDETENTVGDQITTDGSNVAAKQILEAALRGIQRGEEKYNTKVRLILCCIRGKSEWSWDILNLCEEYRSRGVVGIDIAGNDEVAGEGLQIEEFSIFEKAKEKGIHRTIHAGEEGGWESVKQALTSLNAERIGHGYRVIENEDFYKECIEKRVHFEMCPHSSYMTGAIKGLNIPSKRHPILRLAEDGASFSINSDDPTITGTHLSEEYELLRKWGFNEALFTKANFEAAYKCFLPLEEKQELLAELRKAYGIISDNEISTNDKTDNSSRTKGSGSPSLKPAVKIASWEDRTY
ncbi:Adenosine deaminase [Armadillidium vulgare]|nr:Adenosine deaminase [Armadillidium vulgare]